MKKNILIAISLVLAVGFSSCSDFLEENPKSQLTLKDYYKTPSHIEGSVNALYREGVPAFNNAASAYAGPSTMLGGYVSGYFDNEYAGQEVVVKHCQNLTRTAENIANQMDDVWNACYRAINKANGTIKYAPTINGMSDANKAKYIAEAKFFRAYNYFYLVKMFGDVPFYTTPNETTENLELPRTPIAKIYKQIVEDLKEAASTLPTTTFYGNKGRITSNVANTALANVYLQMSGYPLKEDHYADAAAAAKAVIASGNHHLTQNIDKAENSAFNILRTKDGVDEAIYSYEFNATIAHSNWWASYSMPNSAAGWDDVKFAITNNVYGVKNGLLNVYNETEDLRVQPNQFFHWDYTRANGEVAHFKEPANWYYYDETAITSSGKGDKDVNMYRYAEVLLIAAETVAESENVAAAANYLAQVKARSSMTDKSVQAYEAELNQLTKENFIKEVWAERLREFPLEFKIWDDVIRTRQYPTFDAANKGTVTFVNVVGASNNWGKTFQEKDLLWPLSKNELQRNPSLTQNPGY